MIMFVLRFDDDVIKGGERRATATRRLDAGPAHPRPFAAVHSVEPVPAHLDHWVAISSRSESRT